MADLVYGSTGSLRFDNRATFHLVRSGELIDQVSACGDGEGIAITLSLEDWADLEDTARGMREFLERERVNG
jgi:hypothetical protein